jgi:hypothetical protein
MHLDEANKETTSASKQSSWGHRISIGLNRVWKAVRDQGVGGSNPLSPTIYVQQYGVFAGTGKWPDVDETVAQDLQRKSDRNCTGARDDFIYSVFRVRGTSAPNRSLVPGVNRSLRRRPGPLIVLTQACGQCLL